MTDRLRTVESFGGDRQVSFCTLLLPGTSRCVLQRDTREEYNSNLLLDAAITNNSFKKWGIILEILMPILRSEQFLKYDQSVLALFVLGILDYCHFVCAQCFDTRLFELAALKLPGHG